MPMDSEEVDSAKLVPINEAKVWAQLVIEEGQIVEIFHKPSWEDFEEYSEVVIVCDDGEYVWPFMEMNMMVLVAHTQRSIDDIVEAFLFKELHELSL